MTLNFQVFEGLICHQIQNGNSADPNSSVCLFHEHQGYRIGTEKSSTQPFNKQKTTMATNFDKTGLNRDLI